MPRQVRPVQLIAVLGVLAGLTACGGEEREYAVPDHLCQVKVDPDLIAPFLPPGEKLIQKPAEYADNTRIEGCTVYVDGHVVLATKAEWHAAGFTARDAAGVPGPDMHAGGKYASWDRGASTVVRCRAPEGEDVTVGNGEKGSPEIFSIEVHVPVPEDSTEEDMRKFIGPYAEAYRKTLPCEEG